MKITTNFARPMQRAVAPLLVVNWLLAFLAVSGAAWLVSDAGDLRSELPLLRERAARSQSLATTRPEQAGAAAQELARTRERIARLNEVARATGVSSAVLLNELESLLPPQAWLTRLQYRAVDGEVSLVAAASSTEPLSSFLMQLENSMLFEQAMLMREVQQPAGALGVVQFEIRLKVRSS